MTVKVYDALAPVATTVYVPAETWAESCCGLPPDDCASVWPDLCSDWLMLLARVYCSVDTSCPVPHVTS